MSTALNLLDFGLLLFTPSDVYDVEWAFACVHFMQDHLLPRSESQSVSALCETEVTVPAIVGRSQCPKVFFVHDCASLLSLARSETL